MIDRSSHARRHLLGFSQRVRLTHPQHYGKLLKIADKSSYSDPKPLATMAEDPKNMDLGDFESKVGW